MLGKVGVLGAEHAVLAGSAVLLLSCACLSPDLVQQDVVLLLYRIVEVRAHALIDVRVDQLAKCTI